MEKYIKYKRITKDIKQEEEFQEFFDVLVGEGWDILYYSESTKDTATMSVVVVVGKKQENVL